LECHRDLEAQREHPAEAEGDADHEKRCRQERHDAEDFLFFGLERRCQELERVENHERCPHNDAAHGDDIKADENAREGAQRDELGAGDAVERGFEE